MSDPGHMIRICSHSKGNTGRRDPNYEVLFEVLFPGGQPLPYADAQKLFKVSGGQDRYANTLTGRAGKCMDLNYKLVSATGLFLVFRSNVVQ